MTLTIFPTDPAHIEQAATRALITQKAAEVLVQLQQTHGSLFLFQSGGCCEGSAPMCFAEGDYLIGDHDVLLGVVLTVPGDVATAVPIWIAEHQFGPWERSQVIIDAFPQVGAGWSLEATLNWSFVTRDRILNEEEVASLAPIIRYQDYQSGKRPQYAYNPLTELSHLSNT